MIQSFDVQIAEKYGVNAALLFQNIAYWVQYNRANGKNLYDGYYWTYNSRKALCEIFPYLSPRQIETAVQKLIEAGLVLTGNYNEKPYDRTLWYTLTAQGEALASLPYDGRFSDGDALSDLENSSKANSENVKCISQNEEMDFTKPHNGNSENVKPIPNIIPNIIPDIKPNIKIKDDEADCISRARTREAGTGETPCNVHDPTERAAYLQSVLSKSYAADIELSQLEEYIKAAWYDCFGKYPNAVILRDISAAAQVNEMRLDAIKSAIEYSARNSTDTPCGYAVAMLHNWAQDNLHTEDEIIRRDIKLNLIV